MINFTHNFSASEIDLNEVDITISSSSVIVNLSGQLLSGEKKTLYIDDNSFISLCVKDAEIASVSEISSGCNQANETDFTSCLGSSTGISINNLTCYDEGTRIRVENLSYSGIRGVVGIVSTEEKSTSHSGGSILKKNIGNLESMGKLYTGNLSYGWKMLFGYNGENHTIQLKKIHRGNAEVRFEIHSKKIDVVVKEGEDKKIDLDDDGEEDVILRLNKIFENVKVNIGLEIIGKNKVINEDTSGEVVRDIEKKRLSKSVVFGVLFLFVFIFIVLRKRRKFSSVQN